MNVKRLKDRGVAMVSDTLTPLAFAYCRMHERVLKIVDDLSEEQFFHRANPRVHAIAFVVWHLARWADHLQAHLPAMNADLVRLLGELREIWREETLAQRWGFPDGGLGYDETGMLLDDAVVAALPFSSKDVVLDYARRAFAAADNAVSALNERLRSTPALGCGETSVRQASERAQPENCSIVARLSVPGQQRHSQSKRIACPRCVHCV
jgi:hypothetical protein